MSIWLITSTAPAEVFVQQVIDAPTSDPEKMKELWESGKGYKVLDQEVLDPEEIEPDMSEAMIVGDFDIATHEDIRHISRKLYAALKDRLK
jgi:hypothetical protein